MKKKDLLLILGMIIISVGLFLPSIRIANENISFLKENGCLMVIIVLIMFILYMLNKKELMIFPSFVSVFFIVKFIVNNKNRLNEINELYNCYANFKYGLLVMLVGCLFIILTILVGLINYNHVGCFLHDVFVNRLVKLKNNVVLFFKRFNKSCLASLRTKKELNKDIVVQEKNDDGVIKYNKMVVKLNNVKGKQRKSVWVKLSEIISSLKIRRVSNKNLSISKFNNDYRDNIVHKKVSTYKVPFIDIRRWTRNDVCCVNCGATVSSNSEYCFLCDCKVKLSDKHEKLS